MYCVARDLPVPPSELHLCNVLRNNKNNLSKIHPEKFDCHCILCNQILQNNHNIRSNTVQFSINTCKYIIHWYIVPV